MTSRRLQADLLADTVAIMAEGRLLTAGSSLALKRHWSDGYTLVLTLETGAARAPDSARIQQIVRQHVPGASVLRAAAAELVSFRFASPAAYSGLCCVCGSWRTEVMPESADC